nr:NAD(P)-dependent oxidoreductase [Nocardioides halotolerans]
MRVSYIGLGDIGAPMATRIHQQGHQLTVWNRTPARSAPFAEAGVPVAASAAEAADDAEVVVLCIDTPAGVEAVVDQVLKAPRPPAVVVDSSTVHPDLTVSLGARLRAAGVGFVDAPVSGGPGGARAGTLAVMVGGADDDVAFVRPVLDSYARRVTHLGPLGSGQVGKACNQLVNFATMAAIAEAMALGRAFGLDPDALPEAMSGGLADSSMLREYARGRAAGEDTNITGIINGLRGLLLGFEDGPAGGRTDMLLKDLAFALDIARRQGTAAPVAGVLDGVYRMLHNQEAR